MSSAGETVTDAVPQLYFCHQCSRTVTVNLSLNADILCPTCNGGFLEEYEDPYANASLNLDLNPNPFSDPITSFLDSFPLLFSRPSASARRNPRNSSSVLSQPELETQTGQEPSDFDPFAFLEDYIGSLRAGGANIQLIIENHPSDGLPANLGDYVMGSGLEQLIQQLAENDPNRYGNPPASKTAVEALPSITVDEKLLSSELAQCAVCKDDFDKYMVVKQMPCKHVYHSECIMPWLELHNSCPVCRYELPTDDPEYENRTREVAGSGNNSNSSTANAGSNVFGSGGDTVGNDDTMQVTRLVERTFSIRLPWNFRGLASGSGSGTSSGDADNSGDSNNEQSNSGGQQNRGSN